MIFIAIVEYYITIKKNEAELCVLTWEDFRDIVKGEKKQFVQHNVAYTKYQPTFVQIHRCIYRASKTCVQPLLSPPFEDRGDPTWAQRIIRDDLPTKGPESHLHRARMSHCVEPREGRWQGR